MTYTYRAHGLIIAAEFEIPQWQPTVGTPDVAIISGDVPPITGDQPSVYYQRTPQQFKLRVPQIAHYWVCDGEQIIVQPADNADWDVVRLHLFHAPMVALLQQRGRIVFHASGIVRDGSALLFTGLSGIGKSALAAQFYRAGYQILGDDAISVTVDGDGQAWAIPAEPYLQVWNRTARYFKWDAESLTPVRADLKKFYLSTRPTYREQAVPLTTIYMLSRQNKAEFLVAPIRGYAKIQRLARQTHLYTHFRLLKQEGRVFADIVKFAPHVPFKEINRPQSPLMLAELAETVEWLEIGDPDRPISYTNTSD
jgi:hypothetical protein